MKKTLLSIAVAFGLSMGGTAAIAAGGEEAHIENIPFSFDGPFGKFDQNQLQRGLQVYTEVCAACHGLRQVAFRTLADKGGPHYSADQVKAYAAENFEVYDAELDEDRPAKPSDKFPANDSVGAPDLSMMAKARAGFHGPSGLGINQILYGMGGPEYIVAILTGYTGEEKTQAGVTLYENKAFPGGWISMAPPIEDGMVEFADGHANDTHHISEDVASFMMWTAEPKLMARKQLGFVSVAMLALLAVLLWITNKRIWAPIKRKDD
jgi:ubiquinol-cytochrome c reductase cytochrome c1 subunit